METNGTKGQLIFCFLGFFYQCLSSGDDDDDDGDDDDDDD